MSYNTVVVTGGAGFIGSHLARRLLALGNKVVIIDDISTGNIDNINSLFPNENLKFYKTDIVSEYHLNKALDECESDTIFHLAAWGSVPRSMNMARKYFSNNVMGTVNLLDHARIHGIKRVVFSSSSSVYGDNEDSLKTERHTGQVLSPYASTKSVCEDVMRMYHEVYGLETVNLRYFNVFGPRQNPDGDYAAVIPKFINLMLKGEQPTIYGDGEQARDFSYVDNVVEANVLFSELNKKHVAGNTFNVACGQSTSVNNLVSKINHILGTDIQPIYAPPRKGDIKNSCADISEAMFWGYFPEVNVNEGLEKTVEYYQQLS